MLFGEIITFHCENYTKHKYTVWTECKVDVTAGDACSNHSTLNS